MTKQIVAVQSKTCTKCDECKPLTEFWAMANSRDGFAWNCRACAKKASAEWRAANKGKLKASKAEHHAKNRERYNATSRAWYAENKDYASERGKEYRGSHQEELRTYCVEWRKKNLEKSRSGVAAYQAANPEMRKASRQNRRAKIRSAEGTIKKSDVLRLLKLQKGLCVACNVDVSSEYHIDHIYALTNGGDNSFGNLQLLCPACNLSKSAKHPIDFMQSRGFLL